MSRSDTIPDNKSINKTKQNTKKKSQIALLRKSVKILTAVVCTTDRPDCVTEEKIP